MIIMTELDSSTFLHAQSRIQTPKIWCLASGPREWSTGVVRGPREWSVVHEGSPWTRSTKVVHGPGVRVLSFLNYKEFIRFWEFRDRSLITGEGGLVEMKT